MASDGCLVAAFKVRGAMEGPSGMPQGKHMKAQSFYEPRYLGEATLSIGCGQAGVENLTLIRLGSGQLTG